jgi:excisionase family DNA binding protein
MIVQLNPPQKPPLCASGIAAVVTREGLLIEANLTPDASEAARLLSVFRSSIYDLIGKGVIPSVRLGGGSIRIPYKALQRLAADHGEED